MRATSGRTAPETHHMIADNRGPVRREIALGAGARMVCLDERVFTRAAAAADARLAVVAKDLEAEARAQAHMQAPSPAVPDTSVVHVRYERIDGVHFFKGIDGAAAGLCAASPDLEAAHREVATQIVALWRDNHGIAVQVEATLSAGDLATWIVDLDLRAPIPLVAEPKAVLAWKIERVG